MDKNLYELALEKLKKDEDISDFLLNFDPEDFTLIEDVIKSIKAILAREDITPSK